MVGGPWWGDPVAPAGSFGLPTTGQRSIALCGGAIGALKKENNQMLQWCTFDF